MNMNASQSYCSADEKRPTFTQKLFAILVCLVLFLFLVLLLLLNIVRNTVSTQTIKKTLEDSEFMEISLGEDFSETSFAQKHELSEDATIEDAVVSVLEEGFQDLDVSEEQIKDLLNEDETKAFIAENFGVYVSDSLAGTDVDELSDTISEYVDENRNQIEESLDTKISDEDIEKIDTCLKESETKEFLDSFSSNTIKEEITGSAPEVEKAMKLVSVESQKVYFVVLSIVILVLALIIFLVLRDAPHWFRYTGITCLIAGVLMCIAVLILKQFLLTNMEIPAIMESLVETYVTTVLSRGLVLCAVAAAAGAVFLATGIVIGAVRKNRLVAD